MGISINSLEEQIEVSQIPIAIKKSINKIQKHCNHSKKQQLATVSQLNNNTINKISKLAVRTGDIITDLTPEELLLIILDSSNDFNAKKLSAYKYEVEKSLSLIDYIFDDETEDMIETTSEFKIQFAFEIKQIQENNDKYTVVFLNITKEYCNEFNQIVQELIQEILKN